MQDISKDTKEYRRLVREVRNQYDKIYYYGKEFVDPEYKVSGTDVDVVCFKEAIEQGPLIKKHNLKRLDLLTYILKDTYLIGKKRGLNVDWIPGVYMTYLDKLDEYYFRTIKDTYHCYYDGEDFNYDELGYTIDKVIDKKLETQVNKYRILIETTQLLRDQVKSGAPTYTGNKF